MNTKHLHQIVPAILAAGFLVAACGTASAQSILLSDTFNTGGASGSVDSFNGSAASRQTGSSLAGTGYFSKGAYQNINDNQVVFQPAGWPSPVNGFGRLVIDHNFTDAAITTSGGFTISYNYFVPASASGSDNWLAIMVGQTSGTVNTDSSAQVVDSGSDFGMLLRGNGGYDSFNGGGGDNSGTTALNYGTTAKQVVLTILTTSFASGNSATISATVNGSAIDLNGAAVGNDRVITWDAGGANYIQFEDYNNDGYGMNNLVISTVPEPGTMALAALGGASLLFWRRRSK